MLPKPLLLIGGSIVAIMLGNTRLGPIVALLLVAVIAYLALSPNAALSSTSNPKS